MKKRDFIRMGRGIPSRGLSLEDHIIRYKKEWKDEDDFIVKYDGIREWYRQVKNIWAKYHPPKNIRGVYAFVNFPGAIDVSIIPQRYFIDDTEYRDIRWAGDEEIYKSLNNHKNAIFYDWNDIKYVWAKIQLALNIDREYRRINRYCPWTRYSIENRIEFEDIILDRICNRKKSMEACHDVGQIFLEI